MIGAEKGLGRSRESARKQGGIGKFFGGSGQSLGKAPRRGRTESRESERKFLTKNKAIKAASLAVIGLGVVTGGPQFGENKCFLSSL